MDDRPVLLLGHGRSGTTWLAEVLSRSTGEVMLDEPLSPNVWRGPELGCGPRDEDADDALRRHLTACLDGRVRHPFLVRHLLSTHDRSADYDEVRAVQHRPILGFKEKAAEVAWMGARISGRIAFVIRQPHDVVVSCLRRPGWWVFGWPASFHVAMESLTFDPMFVNYDAEVALTLRHEAMRATTMAERTAVMWASFHLVALRRLEQMSLPWFRYERLRFEDGHMERMFAWLGLRYDAELAEPQRPSHSTPSSVQISLSADERRAIDRIVAPVRERFGY